ncbi:hypothetical protein EON66_06645 [archaeon]|nr:MAG: hypothetical protein EON66_06645 [archaeon]
MPVTGPMCFAVGRHRGSDGDAQTRRMPLRIKYLTQISSRPPTFAMFVNRNAGT